MERKGKEKEGKGGEGRREIHKGQRVARGCSEGRGLGNRGRLGYCHHLVPLT